MRPMNLDPTFQPYLDQVLASRPKPIWQEVVVERRARMAALRRQAAPPIPADVAVEDRAIPVRHGTIGGRVYRPRHGEAAAPCVIYPHGGGWMYGSPEQSDENAIRVVRRLGAVVISPDYRLSPEHPFPAGFEDCYDTLCWTSGDARALGIDPARIAMMGDSSGATLVVACALEARERGGPRLALQVLNYPALGTDFETDSYRDNADAPILSRDEMKYFWNAYLADEASRRDPRAVPLAAVDLSGLPPAHIIVAEYDPLRDDGIAFAERLRAAGVAVELRRAERLPHGFLRAWSVSADAAAMGEAFIAALGRAFGVPARAAATL